MHPYSYFKDVAGIRKRGGRRDGPSEFTVSSRIHDSLLSRSLPIGIAKGIRSNNLDPC